MRGPEHLRIISSVLADHPRSCGANRASELLRTIGRGSSPLVRGQLHWFSFHYFVVRIIPARAGPTWRPVPARYRKTDHPRSCGANRVPSDHHGLASGSSPLVRGQRTLLPSMISVIRIIPARAGPTQFPLNDALKNADHPRSCGANVVWDGTSAPPNGSSPLVRGLCLFNRKWAV